jgi:hypothetical protein
MADDINIEITQTPINVSIKQTSIAVSMLQTGPKGDGPVSGATVDANYHLIVSAQGNNYDAGYVRGPAGATGLTGPQGPQGLPGQGIVNLDGGTPSSIYGGITSLDFGGV